MRRHRVTENRTPPRRRARKASRPASQAERMSAAAPQASSRFPERKVEGELNSRTLKRDAVAPADLFAHVVRPLAGAVIRDTRCSDDEGYDSAIDAILTYCEDPERYDPARGRLASYLVKIAKAKGIDRIRSRVAREKREGAYANVVELQPPSPIEELEVAIDAKAVWERFKATVSSEGDRRAVNLILAGERSTQALANALGIGSLPPERLRIEVKRNRDRLVKVLKRIGERLHDG